MIELKIDTHGYEKKLDENAKRFPFRMHKALKMAARKAQTRAAKRVSGPVLSVRTGRLRSSITPFWQRKSKDTIAAGIGSTVNYAATHELGLTVKHVRYKKRPFLKPSAQEAFDWLMKEIEVWHD